jgi:hypothetical protein
LLACLLARKSASKQASKLSLLFVVSKQASKQAMFIICCEQARKQAS